MQLKTKRTKQQRWWKGESMGEGSQEKIIFLNRLQDGSANDADAGIELSALQITVTHRIELWESEPVDMQKHIN